MWNLLVYKGLIAILIVGLAGASGVATYFYNQQNTKIFQASDLNNQVNQLEGQISALNSQITALNKQIDSLNSQISQLQASNTQLGGTNSQLLSQIQQLQTQISQLERNFATPDPNRPASSPSRRPNPETQPSTESSDFKRSLRVFRLPRWRKRRQSHWKPSVCQLGHDLLLRLSASLLDRACSRFFHRASFRREHPNACRDRGNLQHSGKRKCDGKCMVQKL